MAFTETAIEETGNVYLGKNGLEYEILDLTLTGGVGEPGRYIPLQLDGVAVQDGVEPNFTIIQAQQDGSLGYTVLLTDGADYLTWDVDADGNLSTDSAPIEVWEAEVLFGVNLDGDGIIGEVVTITVSDDGTDDLFVGVGVSGQYYLVDPADVTDGATTSATATGVTLDGIAVGPEISFGGDWDMLQVAPDPDNAGGFKALWQNSVDDSFVIWTMDISGNRTATEILDITNADAVTAANVVFGTALTVPDDSEVVTITVSDDGTDDLFVGVGVSGQYYLVDPADVTDGATTSATATGVTLDGIAVGPEISFGGDWDMLQVAPDPDNAGGFKALWQNSVDDSFVIWTMDISGNRTATEILDITNADAVTAANVVFGTALTVPDDSEVVTITVSDDGTDDLFVGVGVSGQYYLVDPADVTDGATTSATATGVTLDGIAVGPEISFGGDWDMLQVAPDPDNAGGFKALWQNSVDDSFVIWTMDISGNRTATEILDITNADAVTAANVVFGTALTVPDDSEVVTITVSDDGTDDLFVGVGVSGQYYLVDPADVTDGATTSATATGVTLDGIAVGPEISFGGDWDMLQVAPDPDNAGGFKALWQNSVDDSFVIWTMDISGNRTATEILDITNADAVTAANVVFGTALTVPDDSEVVTITVSDDGTDDLFVGVGVSGQYYLVDPADVTDGATTSATATGVTLDGIAVGPEISFGGDWDMLQVAPDPDNAGGFKALWQNSVDDSFVIWTMDISGNRTATEILDITNADAVTAANVVFGTALTVPDDSEVVTITVSDDGTDDLFVGVGVSGQYYLVDPADVTDGATTSATATGVTLDGIAVGPEISFGGDWDMLQVAPDPDNAGGFKALWQNSVDDSFVIWTMDISGNRTATEILDITNADAVTAANVVFGTALTVPDDSEVVTITVSDDGTDDLFVGVGVSGQYYLVDPADVTDGATTSATATGVTLDGIAVGPEISFGGDWDMLQVAPDPDNAGGFKALWQNSVDDSFVIWTMDISGNRTATEILDITNADAVTAAEGLFDVDLPGGIEVGPIEANGDVWLNLTLETGEEYAYTVSNDAGLNFVNLTVTGGGFEGPFIDDNPATDTFIWTAVAAEDTTIDGQPDGYQVLFEGLDTSGAATDYFVRVYDSLGVETDLVFPIDSNDAITAAELEFGYNISDAFVFV